MEDILSLDDNVLNSIYEDQIPEVRRVPAILVMKIKVSTIYNLDISTYFSKTKLYLLSLERGR